METLMQDIRYGARMLMKNPGFLIVAVITLGLGYRSEYGHFQYGGFPAATAAASAGPWTDRGPCRAAEKRTGATSPFFSRLPRYSKPNFGNVLGISGIHNRFGRPQLCGSETRTHHDVVRLRQFFHDIGIKTGTRPIHFAVGGRNSRSRSGNGAQLFVLEDALWRRCRDCRQESFGGRPSDHDRRRGA